MSTNHPTTDHGAAGFCTDHGQAVLDVAAIRARADAWTKGDDPTYYAGTVVADLYALLDALAARDAEVERLQRRCDLLTREGIEWLSRSVDHLRERDALAATVARVEHIVSRYGDAHDAAGCAVLHDLRVLLADRPDAPAGATVTREAVEAAWASWFPGTSGPWSTDFRWRLYKALADLGLTVTDTPTEGGRGLRPLPRERYDAVLDSGPTEGDEPR